MEQRTRAGPAPDEFPSVLDVLNDPVLGSDESGEIQYANAAAGRLFGWAPGELVGRPLTSFMPERLHAAHLEGFRRFVRTREAKIIGKPIRVPALLRDGEEIEIELTLSVLPSVGGRLRIIAVMRDLRVRLALERRIAAQKKILAQYAAVGALAGATTAEGAMPMVLEATAQALEWDLGLYWALSLETNRMTLAAAWSCGSPEADQLVAASRGLSFGSGEGLPGQVLASGESMWSCDMGADPRSDGLALGVRSVLLFPVSCAARSWGVLEYSSRHDDQVDEELYQTMKALGFQVGQFLERVENEKELRRAWASAENERRNLQRLFRDAPAAIAIVRGPEMTYELSNTVNQELAGGRELVGKTVREGLPELEAHGVSSMIASVYETGEPYVAREYRVTLPATPDRPERPMFMNGVVQPLRDEGGDVDGVMLLAYDVTDLVTARDRLRVAEERLRLAIEAGNIGTWDYDPATRKIRADARYRRLFGIGPQSSFELEDLLRAIHPEDRARVQEALAHAFDPRSGGEYSIEYRTTGVEDGRERWLSMRGRVMFDEGAHAKRFVGTGTDVTNERRAAEHLRFLASASTILAASLDPRATLVELARLAVPQLADWCMIEVAGEDGRIEQVASVHVDADKADLAAELRRRYPPEATPRAGVMHVLRKGQPIFAPIITDEQLVQAASDGAHLALLRGLGLRSTMVLPIKTREGTIAVLCLVQAGSGRRYAAEDLTFAEEVAGRAAIALENARLYERATKAVGVRDQFLSIASHELRTPLTPLTLQLSALMRTIREERVMAVPVAKLEKQVAIMDKQAGRLAILIDELLDVSRISSGRLEIRRSVVELVGLVADVVARASAEATKAGVNILTDAPGRVTGHWDPNRLDQVFTNLVGNAIKYAPGKPLHVRVREQGNEAVVTFRDLGPGIAPADQQRIFGQFERAAAPSMAGLGLGLWIASRIVDAHQGRIELVSRLGEGSSFTVHLPSG